MKDTKTLVLLSGGMDSVALLYWLKGCFAHEVESVFFNYGANHRTQERRFAEHHSDALGINLHKIQLPNLQGSKLVGDDSESWVVPARNSVLLSFAANFAESHGFDRIAYGCNADDADEFPDCRPGFVDAFNQTLEQAKLHVRVFAPFVYETKRNIVSIATHMHYPLRDSWSCYNDRSEPCGQCPACKKRNAVLP